VTSQDALNVSMTTWRDVRLACVCGGEEVMSATLTSELATVDADPPGDDQLLRLSRFAYARRLDRDLVIESPRSYVRVTMHRPELAALLVAMAEPTTLTRLRERLPSLECLGDYVHLLWSVGIVGAVDADGNLDEDTDTEVVQREFHEVLAHWWSRTGLIDHPVGGIYPFEGRIEPSPAVKQVESDTRVSLPNPDLDRLVDQDPPLAKVMEQRRSVRGYGEHPITVEQLGEFLYRVGRVRGVHPIDPDKDVRYEISNRTYPSAGAAYDIELYVTVWACAGLNPGMYHYDPVGHALSLVCEQARLVADLLGEAHWASGNESVPQVLITLASRFNRLNWKYRGLSYVSTLKNVGVLFEAMYLAATAMGLAPCALGAGNSAIFSRATGLDPLVESSVGEFTLGSLGAEEPG
jgi:oxazoline/thiazoline dehydrogenase